MLMCERYGNKNRPRFFFLKFTFNPSKYEEVILSEDFFREYYNYMEKNQFPFRVEDVVSFYLIKNGYKVDRRYLLRQAIDLSAVKDGKETFIECKSEIDSIKFEQFKIITDLNAEVWFVLPLHHSKKDLRDLQDKMRGG